MYQFVDLLSLFLSHQKVECQTSVCRFVHLHQRGEFKLVNAILKDTFKALLKYVQINFTDGRRDCLFKTVVLFKQKNYWLKRDFQILTAILRKTDC